MPMFVAVDPQSGDILQQVFNFIDVMGGKPSLTQEGTLILNNSRSGKVPEHSWHYRTDRRDP